MNIKCASTYFRYGAALFYKAQDEQDVFGSSLQAATAHEEADVAEDDESGKCSFLQSSAQGRSQHTWLAMSYQCLTVAVALTAMKQQYCYSGKQYRVTVAAAA